MNIVDQKLQQMEWELDNTVGYLTMFHGNYMPVIRRAAQMRYKQNIKAGKPGNFIQHLWHYHGIEKQKYPAGRQREFTYCPTCRNSYGPAFKRCPVCADLV